MPELHAPAGPRVLLVEDDAAIRDTLAELLREEGCAVTPVSHGREALAQLRRSALPDVIILDLMMPVMDGWEFRRQQQADPALAPVPVIVLSALDQARASSLEAEGFLKKPLDFDRLISLVRTYCH